MDIERLGTRLRSLRKNKELTLEDVASSLGISSSYLSEVERGRKVPSLKTLCNLVGLLDLSRSFLLDVLDAPTEATTLGDVVRLRREELGFTASELARILGWSEAYIERLERNELDLPGEYLSELSRTLGLPDFLFEATDYVSTGKIIRFFRERNELTQSELANNSDTSASLVSKIEREEVKPSLETLTKLSRALEISPCCLMPQFYRKGESEPGTRTGKETGEPPGSEYYERLIINALPELSTKQLKNLVDYISDLRE